MTDRSDENESLEDTATPVGEKWEVGSTDADDDDEPQGAEPRVPTEVPKDIVMVCCICKTSSKARLDVL